MLLNSSQSLLCRSDKALAVGNGGGPASRRCPLQMPGGCPFQAHTSCRQRAHAPPPESMAGGRPQTVREVRVQEVRMASTLLHTLSLNGLLSGWSKGTVEVDRGRSLWISGSEPELDAVPLSLFFSPSPPSLSLHPSLSIAFCCCGL